MHCHDNLYEYINVFILKVLWFYILAFTVIHRSVHITSRNLVLRTEIMRQHRLHVHCEMSTVNPPLGLTFHIWQFTCTVKWLLSILPPPKLMFHIWQFMFEFDHHFGTMSNLIFFNIYWLWCLHRFVTIHNSVFTSKFHIIIRFTAQQWNPLLHQNKWGSYLDVLYLVRIVSYARCNTEEIEIIDDKQINRQKETDFKAIFKIKS